MFSNKNLNSSQANAELMAYLKKNMPAQIEQTQPKLNPNPKLGCSQRLTPKKFPLYTQLPPEYCTEPDEHTLHVIWNCHYIWIIDHIHYSRFSRQPDEHRLHEFRHCCSLSLLYHNFYSRVQNSHFSYSLTIFFTIGCHIILMNPDFLPSKIYIHFDHSPHFLQ